MTKLKFICKNLIVIIVCFTLILSLPFSNFANTKSAEESDKVAYAASVTVGDFTIGLNSSVTPSVNKDYTYTSNLLTILTTASLTIGMKTAGSTTTKDSIQVKTIPSKTSNITVDKVKIDSSSISPFSVVSGGTLSLTLKGENSFSVSQAAFAGLGLSESSNIEIDEDSSEGSLIAQSGMTGAGIGGGYQSSAGSITINGGTVAAMSATYGAGIGGEIGRAHV
jgi:hypothetical protein